MQCFVLLGNHESQTMNEMYGFQDEVKVKYTSQMADLFTEVYNWLPLAHCINNKVFVSTSILEYITSSCLYCIFLSHSHLQVAHGGLFSKDNVALDDIKNIDRNRQPPDEGMVFFQFSLLFFCCRCCLLIHSL